MCTHAKDHARTLKMSSMSEFGDYGNKKITQHALKVSVFIMSRLDTIRKKKKNPELMFSL